MTPRAFQTGDVVSLRSGGPSMTVEAVSDELTTCILIDKGCKLRREQIPNACLRYGSSEDSEIGPLIISGVTHTQAQIDAMFKEGGNA